MAADRKGRPMTRPSDGSGADAAAGRGSAVKRAVYGLLAHLLDYRGRPVAVLALLVVVAVGALSDDRDWQPVHRTVFDTYQRLYPRIVDRFPVVIVDIDEESLAALGRWPWPRTRLAALTAATYRLGALSVGFDLILPEPDQLSPDTVLAHHPEIDPGVLKALANIPSNDEILAGVLRGIPSVVGRGGLIEGIPEDPVDVGQTPAMIVGASPVDRLTAYRRHLVTLPSLEAAAYGRGYLNDTRDNDGVVRTMPVVLNINSRLAPAMALELLRTAMGANWYTVHGDDRGMTGVQLGDAFMPTDPDGRIHLHFSPAYAGRRVPAVSVLRGAIEANAFSGQIALIAVTGVGVIDVAATPVAARMDGVEIQAQFVENLLDNARLVRPPNGHRQEMWFFVALALGFIVLLPRLNLGMGIIAYMTVAALTALAAIAAFQQIGHLYDPTLPVAGSALVVIALFMGGYADTNRARRALDEALAGERLAHERIAGELQAARDIQMGMLPDPDAIEGLPVRVGFHAVLKPAAAVGGDLYDAFMIDDRRLFFLVGDVAGKGVGAALFMALSKTLFKSTALGRRHALGEIMTVVNEALSRENPAMLFVTAIAGIIDAETGEVAFCRAGHDNPLMLSPDGTARWMDVEGGPPLCAMEDFTYTAASTRIAPGGMLVMVSDGVTEAFNGADEFYGKERIKMFIEGLGPSQRDAASVCNGLHADVGRFAQGHPQTDDITILVVHYRP